MTMLAAYGFRSAIDFRWYLAAVAWVTVTESLSVAEAGLSTSSEDGSLAASAASTSVVVFAVLDGSTATESRVPLYSGMIEIVPFWICG